MGELDDFKRNINLMAVAASYGYFEDERESAGRCHMMRHPNGDKIAIKEPEDGGFWVYFSNRDDRDHGTVLDFIQWREGGSLGQVRQKLRDWRGSGGQIRGEKNEGLLFPEKDNRKKVRLAWEQARFRSEIGYLIRRGIGPDLLGSPRFAECLRVDRRGNVLFPHYDKQGLCGFEMKNQGFTGFSSGGKKGLWFSLALPTDLCLVLAESAIDALSYAILRPDPSARYMSTGGSLNNQQPGLIRGAFEKMAPGSVVVLAFDNDEAGEKLAAEVQSFAPSSIEVRRGRPLAKDWNQDLKKTFGLE